MDRMFLEIYIFILDETLDFSFNSELKFEDLIETLKKYIADKCPLYENSANLTFFNKSTGKLLTKENPVKNGMRLLVC